MPDLTTLLSKFLTDLYSGSIGGSSQWSSLTLTKNAIGVTPTGALFLVNTTDAAAGAQQMSPALRFRGEGWKTDATAASQTVDFLQDVLPVQGTSAPTGSWRLGSAINGGSRTNWVSLTSAGAMSLAGTLAVGTNPATANGNILLPNGAAAGLGFRNAANDGNTALITFNASDHILLQNAANGVTRINNTLFVDSSIFFGAAQSVALTEGATDRLDLASGDSFRVVSGNINIASGEFQSAGNRVNYTLSAYGAGAAYALTNSAAAIDFGTTDPAIVLDKAGTYLIRGQVNLAYNGATVVAETATIKVRRTNNTAADLSAVVVLDLPVATTLTHTYGLFTIPPFVYTTSATDDAVTLFANVSAALGAGTIDATAIGTAITAVRLY